MSDRVPLEHYPGMNRFVLDWLHGDERFLPRGVGQASGLSLRAAARKQAGGLLYTALVQSNQRWGISAANDLKAWAAGETLTIIAGQQVGFAGGPLYTLVKLASLVRLKRDLEAKGTPVTAFFWLATEDHDFAEVATLHVPVVTLPKSKDVNRQLDLVCMRAARSTAHRSVVGPLPVPETLITQLLALYDMPRPSWLREGITFGDSFAELVATITGNEVILVDALLPEVRRAGAPLFDSIRTRHDEIQRTLANRAAELERAGYSEQVVPRDGEEYTLLYELDEQGNRQPAAADRQPNPERTSTSALTRPLLQDFVFQPDLFIGGPAEVAYYAQLSPLHELLDVPMPRVGLRGHVLVAPRRVVRAFERYGIEPADVFRNPDELLAEREPEGVAKIQALSDEAKRELMQSIAAIGELALPADHSLAGSIQRSVGHLEYHFAKLSERAIKGLVRKDRERYAAVGELVATLHPDRHVQDRIVSWFAWWCVYGEQLVERVIEEVEPDTAAFKIVAL
jgi:bacillithiol biosynthesis cysteine-adding enzyme BshC